LRWAYQLWLVLKVSDSLCHRNIIDALVESNWIMQEKSSTPAHRRQKGNPAKIWLPVAGRVFELYDRVASGFARFAIYQELQGCSFFSDVEGMQVPLLKTCCSGTANRAFTHSIGPGDGKDLGGCRPWCLRSQPEGSLRWVWVCQ